MGMIKLADKSRSSSISLVLFPEGIYYFFGIIVFAP